MTERQTLPGTVIPREGQKDAGEILDALFLGGGLVLCQVTELIGIEGYMVQNWVRRGYLTPPQGKRYTKRQFCRILLINLLRDSLNIGEITDLISRINGHLDDESDDRIDDAQLYVYFVRLLDEVRSYAPGEVQATSRGVVADFVEPEPGVRKVLADILVIMFFAYNSAEMIKEARARLSKLPVYKDIGGASEA